MKNQKGFAHIILILVVVVVAIGGIYYFVFSKNKDEEVLGPIGKYIITTNPSTPNTMVDWKTYTNIKHRFSLDYPSGWVASGLTSDSDRFSFSFEGSGSGGPGPRDFAGLVFNMYKLNRPLLDEVKTDYKSMQENQGKNLDYDEISERQVGDVVGYSFPCFFLIPQECIYIQVGSGYLHILLNYADEFERGYSTTIDQILSTFKFLDSNSESNLNLYSNKELGFSLNYPKTFSVGQDGWSRIGDNPKGNWILELNAENPKINLNLDVRVNPVTAGGKPILKVEDAIQGVSYSKTTMDGRPALTFTTSGIGGMNNKSVYALDGNTLYQLIEYDWEARDADWSNLNQILSTFKFLD